MGTSEKNTLDLIYTNEVSMITQVEIMKSNMSDHERIELTTNIKSGKRQTGLNESRNKEKENCLRKLNFNMKNIEWEKIKKELEAIQWTELFKDKDTEICLEILLEIILNLCKNYIPEKTEKTNSIIPKKRTKLFNKNKMLRRSKRR